MNILTTIIAIIGITAGLWSLHSIDVAEREFLANVTMSLLGMTQDRQPGTLKLSLKNAAAHPVNEPIAVLTIASAPQAAERTPAASLAPGKNQLVALRAPAGPLTIGDDVQLCVSADGPLPFTHAFWIKQYRVARFEPKPGGRPLCSFATADTTQHPTLSPAMLAELKAGCISPELSNPERDYSPAATALKDVSARDGWNIFLPSACYETASSAP